MKQYDENAEKYGYEGEMTPLKCDELTPIELECNMGKDSVTGLVNREPWNAYDIDEVDAAIAKLKAENKMLKEHIAKLKAENKMLKEHIANGDVSRITWIDEVTELKAENERLKAKLESVQATAYADSVDAGMRERRLRRALWLARAKRATEKADSFIDIKVTYCGVCNINHSVYPENNARRMLTCDEWLDVWTNVWDKCLKKAEEYK